MSQTVPAPEQILTLAKRAGVAAPTFQWVTEGNIITAKIWSNPPGGARTLHGGLRAKVSWRGVQTAKNFILVSLAVSFAHTAMKCSCTAQEGRPCPAGLAFLRSLEATQAA